MSKQIQRKIFMNSEFDFCRCLIFPISNIISQLRSELRTATDPFCGDLSGKRHTFQNRGKKLCQKSKNKIFPLRIARDRNNWIVVSHIRHRQVSNLYNILASLTDFYLGCLLYYNHLCHKHTNLSKQHFFRCI